MFDGKQLYHKQDDLTDLQAAIVSQQGKIVLSAARDDSDESERLLEVQLLAGYLKAAGMAVVDLSATTIIEGSQRSKPVAEAIRKRISNSVKFVEIGEIPNKISWLVGKEVWINTAHPLVSRVYARMQERSQDETLLALLEVFVSVVSYELSDAFRSVCAALDAANQKLGAAS